MQLVHELRCGGNITRTRNDSEYILVLVAWFTVSVSLCLCLYLIPFRRHYHLFTKMKRGCGTLKAQRKNVIGI